MRCFIFKILTIGLIMKLNNLKFLYFYFSFFVFSQIFSNFDLAKIDPQTEKFVLDVIKELENNDLQLDKKPEILHSDALPPVLSNLRIEPVLALNSQIYINERFLNSLTVPEKKYLVGRAILLQKTYFSKANKTALFYVPTILLSFCVTIACTVGFIDSLDNYRYERNSSNKNLFLYGAFTGAFSLGYLIVDLISKTNKRILKADQKAIIKLNAFDGAIDYYKRLVKMQNDKPYKSFFDEKIKLSNIKIYESKIKELEDFKKENNK